MSMSEHAISILYTRFFLFYYNKIPCQIYQYDITIGDKILGILMI
jgi:hypothetical protein